MFVRRELMPDVFCFYVSGAAIIVTCCSSKEPNSTDTGLTASEVTGNDFSLFLPQCTVMFSKKMV
jgi:hypothetical protein